MKGVVLRGDRQVELVEFPDPTPVAGEVVIEIRASGMCGTDLKYYRGSSQTAASLGLKGAARAIISGHEPCGVVVAAGPGVPAGQAQVGRRVMQHHYRGCFACSACDSGWTQLCEHGLEELYGVSGHGAHARYMKCPARTLVALPDELSFEAGAAISCGTGTAWGALERVSLKGSDTLVVFGQGPVGLSATMLAASMGARVIAIDVNDNRLSRAKECGASHTINPDKDDVIEAVRALTKGKGADASVEASSAPSARVQAVQCLKTWGTACYVGEGGNVTLDVSSDMIRRQASVVGSWTFSLSQQRACAEFVAQRKLDLDWLFTGRWKLEDAASAYEVFDRQADGKGVLYPV